MDWASIQHFPWECNAALVSTGSGLSFSCSFECSFQCPQGLIIDIPFLKNRENGLCPEASTHQLTEDSRRLLLVLRFLPALAAQVIASLFFLVHFAVNRIRIRLFRVRECHTKPTLRHRCKLFVNKLLRLRVDTNSQGTPNSLIPYRETGEWTLDMRGASPAMRW